MVGASKDLTTPLEDILADLIEPLTKIKRSSREVQSMEEVLRSISEANTKLERDNVKELVIGSMDIAAYYCPLR